jgi:hypothetical protein
MTQKSRTDILDTIKALLAKADPSRNTNPAEIAIAQKKAQELMAKYEVELAEVLANSESPDDILHFTKQYVRQHPSIRYSKMLEHRLILMGAVAKINSCRVLISGPTFVLLGRPEQIQIATQMFYSIDNQLDVAVTKEVRSLSESGEISSKLTGRYNTGVYRRSWLQGAVVEIASRLIQQWEASRKSVESTSTTALVLVTDQALKKYQDELYPNVTQRGESNAMHRDDAYWSGVNAGKGINPFAGLNSSSNKQLKG